MQAYESRHVVKAALTHFSDFIQNNTQHRQPDPGFPGGRLKSVHPI